MPFGPFTLNPSWLKISLLGFLYTFLFTPIYAANPDGDLRIEIVSAYNLVVDSNVESPSTYGPKSFFIGAKICNDGTNDLTDVFVYVGNYIDGTNDTPGIYPVESVDESALGYSYSGNFSLTHSAIKSDAIRFLGTIPAGTCVTQYWLVEYPSVDGSGNAVWGSTRDPDDDLQMDYDVWATATDGGSNLAANTSKTVTCRNEISAMANKIWPNGDNKVPDAYKAAIDDAFGWDLLNNSGNSGIYPGEDVINLQGIWYDLGNINKGFDNNGDYTPDYNVWLQPVGDPGFYDPDCFRLVKTFGLLVIKLKTGGEHLIPFQDQLYFENIPENTGGVGLVYYEFVPVNGPCTSFLTPYQEVASGSDNEKFNGDFGNGQIPLAQTLAPTISLAKTNSPAQVSSLPATLTYTLAYSNSATVSIGQPPYGLHLVIQDSIPTGTEYIAGSAATGNTLPTGVLSYNILYSTDNRNSWTITEPSPASSVTDIQWWLSDDLDASESGSVTFQVNIPSSFSDPMLINTGYLSFGNSAPFTNDTSQAFLPGINSLSGTVWEDDGGSTGTFADGTQDGDEGGINNISISLYYDLNGDGAVDSGDLFWGTTSSDVSGNYSFANLPDGNYLTVLDQTDADLPAGWGQTSPLVYSVDLDAAGASGTAVSDANSDFGYAPPLSIDKTENSGGTIYEDGTASYTLLVKNNLAGSDGESVGDGFSQSTCTFAGSALTIPSPTVLTLADDDLTGAISLSGFNFKYYGEVVSEMYISSNGLVSFQLPAGNGYPVASLPSADYPKTVAFSWGDIDPSAGGTVQYGYVGSAPNRILVIDFNDVPHYNVVGQNVTAQVQFYESTHEIRIVTTSQPQPTGTHTMGMSLDASTAFLVTGRNNQSWTASNECLSFAYSQPAYDSINSLAPVPLTDSYDPTELEFLTASVPPSSINETTGKISWDNIGPIHPGGEQSITLNFKPLGDVSNTNQTVWNKAIVDNAYFVSGLTANADSDSVSITVVPTGSISGYLWSDADGDGWIGANGYEAGESFMEGVRVVLHGCSNLANNGTCNVAETLDTVYTDANGYYEFESLNQNVSYYVAPVLADIPGTSITQTGDPDDDPTNGSGNGGTCGSGGANARCDDIWDNGGNWFQINVDSWGGEAWELSNINFGYSIPPAISGTVWEDIDNDGTQDESETGQSGVSVELQHAGCTAGVDCPTATTDTNGNYTFEDLTAGVDYTIVVSTGTLPATGSWTETAESDASVNNSIIQNLSSGEIATANNFGFSQSGTASIGDTLFYDWNENGTQDGGDEGAKDITVSLYRDVDGNNSYDSGTDLLISTTTTDANGYYLFSNLAAADYLLVVDESDTDFVNSSQSVDPDESGTCSICDNQSAITTNSSSSYLDQDFGYFPFGVASIGDVLWYDADGNGSQSGVAEIGIADISMYLYADLNGDNTYVLVDSTVTASDGSYGFANLPDGNFRVVADSTDAQMLQDGSGNFYNSTTGASTDLVISSGSVSNIDGNSCSSCDNNLDFGFAPLGVIGDMIFWDANNNGTQDWDEEGIPAVTVYLCSGDVTPCNSGSATYTTTTSTGSDGNPAGWYQFSGLLPGTYTLGVETASGTLAGVSQTADPNSDGIACDDALLVSYGYDACDNIYAIPVNYGTNFTGGDFGYQASGVIGDYVWFDQNGDGIQDSGEAGHAGDTLWICASPGPCTGATAIDTAITDFDGLYTFTDITDGTYAITLEVPGSMAVTSGSESVGSSTVQVTMSSGAVSNIGGTGCSDCGLNVDFGLELSGTNSIAGTICLDDGSEDGVCTGLGGEAVLNAVSVNLYNDAGDFLGTTTTDPSGNYSFSNLPNDTYIVAVGTSLAPLDDADLTTTNADVPGGGTITETSASTYQTIAVSSAITDADFAFKLTSSVDFGDLINTYSSVSGLLEDGARHIQPVSQNLYLGITAPDSETDYIPTSDASGDGTEDDGVSFGNSENWTEGATVDGKGGDLDITVSGSGWLVAWIDFNNDGDFTDSAEMVISQAVTSGTQSYTFGIPAGTFNFDADLANLYARFRLFETEPPVAQFAYAGSTYNGEIEDYYFQAGATLPVEWLSFRVEQKGPVAILNWETAIELNNDRFIVERSIDKQLFEPIGSVKGKGNSTEITAYSFTDEKISETKSPILNYRLKQVDLDGSFEYSKTLEIQVLQEDDLFLLIYPNPADQSIFVRYNFSAHLNAEKHLKVYDVLGHVINSKTLDKDSHVGEIQIPVDKWVKGYYYISIASLDQVKIYKVLIK